MSYVGGFVIAVPKANIEAYKTMSLGAGKVWMEYGALAYVETVGEDTPVGEATSFPRAVQLKDDEVVVFSWIVYASKADREAIDAKVMADPRLAELMSGNLFDAKRMIHGGFETLLSLP